MYCKTLAIDYANFYDGSHRKSISLDSFYLKRKNDYSEIVRGFLFIWHQASQLLLDYIQCLMHIKF